MRHRKKFRKFNRTSAHRRAMLRNLACSLIIHGQIKTTVPKAKSLRPYIEKLVTLSLKQTLHSRRVLISRLGGKDDVVKVLIKDLSSRYANRNGGYTRIVRAGYRAGDNAPLAIIAFC